MRRKQSLFTKKIMTSIFLGLVLSIVLGSIIVVFVPTTPSPVVSLIESDNIPMHPESSTRIESLDSTFNGCILNVTPFPGDIDWIQQVVSHEGRSEYEAIIAADGQHISSSHSETTYRTDLNVGFQNLTSLSFTVELESVSGTTDVAIYTGFRRLGDLMSVRVNNTLWDLTHYSIERSFEDNERDTLSIDSPLDMIRNATDDWILQVEFRVILITLSPSTIIVKGVRIEAEYSTEVSPVQIDPMTTRGTSIYANPYSIYLNPSPFLNITNNATNNFSLAIIKAANDTFYLPLGEYNGTAGWNLPARFNATTSIDFTIEENAITIIEPEIPTIKVTVVVSPNVPSLQILMRFRDPQSRVTITPQDGVSYSYWYYSFSHLVESTPISLYIPLIDGDLLIDVTSWDADLFSSSYFTQFYECGVDGVTDLTMDIKLPYFEFLGLALAPGETIVFSLLIAIILAGFVLLWRNTDIQIWEHLGRDAPSVSFLFLVGSLFVPWFTLSQSIDTAGGTYTIEYVAFVALLIIFARSGGSLILPVNFPIWPFLPAVIFTIWLPLILIIRSFMEPPKNNLTFLYSLIGPLIMFVSLILYSDYLGVVISLSIGAYMILMVPVAGLLIYTYNRFRSVKDNSAGGSN